MRNILAFIGAVVVLFVVYHMGRSTAVILPPPVQQCPAQWVTVVQHSKPEDNKDEAPPAHFPTKEVKAEPIKKRPAPIKASVQKAQWRPDRSIFEGK